MNIFQITRRSASRWSPATIAAGREHPSVTGLIVQQWALRGVRGGDVPSRERSYMYKRTNVPSKGFNDLHGVVNSFLYI